MRGVIIGLCIVLVFRIGHALPQYGSGLDVDVPLPVDVISSVCPTYTHDCVPIYQCDNGFINTDGAGLIDLRIKTQSECTPVDFPDVPGVCCQIPGATVPPTPAPLLTCPGNQVCLHSNLCSAHVDLGLSNIAGTSEVHSCYVNPTSDEIGVCCDPPIPVFDVCPVDSVCLPEILCLGDALDISENFIPYSTSLTWSKCNLSGLPETQGVCCRNPVTTPPPPPPAADKCGVRNYGFDVRSHPKLQKNEAQFGEFPWQAVLFFSNYTFKCGASLIEDRWLITGAHCVNGHQYSDFKVRLGEWRVDTYDEPLPYQDVDIQSITIHPDFNPKNVHNNLAIIELVAPVQPQYHINTVCLPESGQLPLPGARCFASGWGKDAFDGQYQAILKKVDLPVVENAYCQDLLRKTRLGQYFNLDQSFMCAGGEENIDACTGDGGGPLVCEDPISGSYFLQGITSWGINCGHKDVPGVYADVQYFRHFIDEVIYGGSIGTIEAESPVYGRK